MWECYAGICGYVIGDGYVRYVVGGRYVVRGMWLEVGMCRYVVA